jgi:hypothetical protein
MAAALSVATILGPAAVFPSVCLARIGYEFRYHNYAESAAALKDLAACPESSPPFLSVAQPFPLCPAVFLPFPCPGF